MSSDSSDNNSSSNSSNNSASSSTSQISLETFEAETSEFELRSLDQTLNLVLPRLLERDNQIHLEGLGLLISTLRKIVKPRIINRDLVVREETVRSVSFEKCDQLLGDQLAPGKIVAGIKELARLIYPLLPIELQVRWSERDCRRYLRGYFKFLRREIISVGYSSRLGEVADFYALHNRQGTAINDWFAGADIFISPKFQQIVEVTQPRVFERPILKDAFEPLRTVFGPPIASLELNLVQELSQMGYSISEMNAGINLKYPIKVSVFKGPAADDSARQILIYCTEGVRRAALRDPKEKRATNELVVQISCPADFSPDILPGWPLKALSLAWALLQGSRSKRLRVGAGIAADTSLTDNPNSTLSAIVINEFKAIPTEQLTFEGPFYYANVLPIFADEARLAEDKGPAHLLTLLSRKGLDQLANPKRSSVLGRSVLFEVSYQETGDRLEEIPVGNIKVHA